MAFAGTNPFRVLLLLCLFLSTSLALSNDTDSRPDISLFRRQLIQNRHNGYEAALRKRASAKGKTASQAPASTGNKIPITPPVVPPKPAGQKSNDKSSPPVVPPKPASLAGQKINGKSSPPPPPSPGKPLPNVPGHPEAHPSKDPQGKPFISMAKPPDKNKPLPIPPTYENVKDKKNIFQQAKMFVKDREGFKAWKTTQGRVKEAHQLELQSTGKNRIANQYVKDSYENAKPVLNVDNAVDDHLAKERARKWYYPDKAVGYFGSIAGKKLVSPIRRRSVSVDDYDDIVLLVTRHLDAMDEDIWL